MVGKRKPLLVLLTVGLLVGMLPGCNLDASRLTKPMNEDNDPLIRVQIYFTDDKTLISYVKDLQIAPDAKVYVGGASTNYLYDSQGRVIGAFNYQRVLYMKILPAEQP